MFHPSTDKINNYYHSGGKNCGYSPLLPTLRQIPKNSLCRSIYRKMVGIETLDALLYFFGCSEVNSTCYLLPN